MEPTREPTTVASDQKADDISHSAPPYAPSVGEADHLKGTIVADLDVAAQYADVLGPDGYTKSEERSVRWRVDRRVMPILCFNVILASVDKTSTATGAL